MIRSYFLQTLLWIAVAGFAGTVAAQSVDTGRWYSAEQVEQGRGLFQQHCAACHGNQAQGKTANWKQRLPDGSFPPPPLNGTAHAWHHPMNILRSTVYRGGIPLGGKMPGFGDKLQPEEIDAVIAYFQSFWNDRIYQAWLQRNR